MFVKAINHVTAANLSFEELLDLAESIGCEGVEIRNDLSRLLFDGMAAETALMKADEHGLKLYALSEVKAFNDWSEAKLKEASDLIGVAKRCGAGAVSLIPRNDGLETGGGQRLASLRHALGELAELLAEERMIAFVEPLGFETSSLRFKSEIVEATDSLGVSEYFKLVHDTFHHCLSGEKEFFPEHTGIIHVSGVVDESLTIRDMRDEHRELVDGRDRTASVLQVRALVEAGYRGPVSLECFASSVQELENPGTAISISFDYITAS